LMAPRIPVAKDAGFFHRREGAIEEMACMESVIVLRQNYQALDVII
jgi:hypothetical protein